MQFRNYLSNVSPVDSFYPQRLVQTYAQQSFSHSWLSWKSKRHWEYRTTLLISRLPLLMHLWNAYDMKEKMTEEATMLHFEGLAVLVEESGWNQVWEHTLSRILLSEFGGEKLMFPTDSLVAVYHQIFSLWRFLCKFIDIYLVAVLHVSLKRMWKTKACQR